MRMFISSRGKKVGVLLALLGLSHAGLADGLPTPPDIWKAYDPDAGDYKEEIVSERTESGIYYRDSYISAYVNGEEIRVFCKYAVKEGVDDRRLVLDLLAILRGEVALVA